MNGKYQYSSLKFLLMLAIILGSTVFMYSKVWAASDVAATVSSDFLKRLNSKLTEQTFIAPPKPAAPDQVQEDAPQQTTAVTEEITPRIQQPTTDAQFGPAPKFIHDNGRFIESTPNGVMLGWWDLPTGTIIFGYGPGGGIHNAHVVVHGTEKSFLKPENLSTALTSSKIAGLKLPEGIAYQEMLVSKFISETPTNVAHGWWNKPDGAIVFARNASGRPMGAFLVVHGEKTHLKPMSLNEAFKRAGGATSSASGQNGQPEAQAAGKKQSRSQWLGKEYQF